ncbi:MAG TPA: serine hydrolase domain-containing protein [Gemmatimonadaceae bacterium]|nr:serine hydrolase domain-containing protein [Gemmatimonadaceae bacterium]
MNLSLSYEWRSAIPRWRSNALRRVIAAVAAVAVVAPAARAQHKPAAAAAPAAWHPFTTLFDSAAHSDSVVGAAVLLMRDGRVVAHHEFGWADRARGQRVTERTIFHYGSITKQLTAISIMQLRDRGKLTLNDRVTSYIPELRQVHDPYGSMDSITIRMLMSHSAGFQNPTWPYKQGLSWEPFEPTTWAQLVAMMPYQELYFKPGSRYSYSNPGFIYLGRIISELTDDPWETYVQKNILSPLGLTRSYFNTTPYYLADDRSANYTVVHDSATGRPRVQDNGREFDPGITIPNGGWNAPLADLATYLAFLTDASRGDTALEHRYGIVLPRASLAEMWHPLYLTTPDTAAHREWMGMSFFVLPRGASTLIGHTGSQAGFLAFMYFNPATKAAVVAAFNTNDDSAPDGKPSAFETIRQAALALIQ